MNRFLAALVVVAFATTARSQERVTADDLKNVGIAYHTLFNDKNKAPKKAEEMAPYMENNKELLDHLKSRRIEFIYGVGVLDMKDGTANTILAYEKDAPKKGGLCLYGDASVRKLTAEEFEKAIKAKPKKQ